MKNKTLHPIAEGIIDNYEKKLAILKKWSDYSLMDYDEVVKSSLDLMRNNTVEQLQVKIDELMQIF